MRQLQLLKQEIKAQQPNLGVLTSVMELTRYDMIYVHHQIKEGSELQLKREQDHFMDPYAVEVYYKGFKIGYLSTNSNRVVAKLLDRGCDVETVVKQRPTRSFNPFEYLDIEVRAIV